MKISKLKVIMNGEVFFDYKKGEEERVMKI